MGSALYSRLRSSVASAALLSSSFLIAPTGSFALGPRSCSRRMPRTFAMMSSITETNGRSSSSGSKKWSDVLPFEDGSHRSARIAIPAHLEDGATDAFDPTVFSERLANTVTACRALGKSSVWVEVPMVRCSLIEKGGMHRLGFQFHHAVSDKAVLNLWLNSEQESKVPEFATHNVGVGAVVVNSRDEILCVRELRKNYMPWKTPTGLSELGEQIDAAVVREVLEETGIQTEFHSILSFRQTHELAHGRSDMFFVCRLSLVEKLGDDGKPEIPKPTAQACEIEAAAWVPLSEYRAMIHDAETGGHPMMRHVIKMYDAGKRIEKIMVPSVIPGRRANAMFFPSFEQDSS